LVFGLKTLKPQRMPKASISTLHTFSERNLLRLARQMVKNIKKGLRDRMSQGYPVSDPSDIKGTHQADYVAFEVIKTMVRDIKARVVVEGMPVLHPELEAPILYIDPIDGSRNWDRQVGDPGFAMAYSAMPGPHSLNDLQFAYVEGLLSGDIHYTLKGKAYYRNFFSGKTQGLQRIAMPGKISELVAYIKPGYSAGGKVLSMGSALIREVKDIRSFDNSAMELCHLAKGSCDLILEVRDLSDYFNLLAWPIVRATQGGLFSLEGADLSGQVFVPEKVVNFIALREKSMIAEILSRLGKA
jgi:fructose-1,6-bisphosphatase/inositol monophosphatase family enzyme